MLLCKLLKRRIDAHGRSMITSMLIQMHNFSKMIFICHPRFITIDNSFFLAMSNGNPLKITFTDYNIHYKCIYRLIIAVYEFMTNWLHNAVAENVRFSICANHCNLFFPFYIGIGWRNELINWCECKKYALK